MPTNSHTILNGTALLSFDAKGNSHLTNIDGSPLSPPLRSMNPRITDNGLDAVGIKINKNASL